MAAKQSAAITAANLVKTTAETTAMALNIQYMQKDISEIKVSIKEMVTNDSNFVKKDEFIFWRNLLVGGMLLTVFSAVIVNLFK